MISPSLFLRTAFRRRARCGAARRGAAKRRPLRLFLTCFRPPRSSLSVPPLLSSFPVSFSLSTPRFLGFPPMWGNHRGRKEGKWIGMKRGARPRQPHPHPRVRTRGN
ncbi:hypothetical protein PUN28_010230 [Cardiocondyla obscurior]|uniref:Ribosomal protein L2 n=1 Tax=Cardiocondyla obscurior TaxID=286306 RepID=A0AAW2FQ57_9HYME